MKATSTHNLYPAKVAREIGHQNEQKLLQFLLYQKYSTAAILKDVIGLQYNSSMRKLLRRLLAKGWVKKHAMMSNLVLWGITQPGLYEAQNDQGIITEWHYFEPSKVKLSMLEHHLDIQRVHVVCIRKGIEFTLGQQMGSRGNADKIPDGMIITPTETIAVEIERYPKSRRRYDAIIYHYLKQVKARAITQIWYISPTEKKANQIKSVMHSIDRITMKVGGRNQTLNLDSKVHLSFFHFIALDKIESRLV